MVKAIQQLEEQNHDQQMLIMELKERIEKMESEKIK
jgi:hypothetical protein